MRKKSTYLLTLLLTALFLLPWSGMKADPSTLTVANGSATNSTVPVYGTQADNYQHNQLIYTSSVLGDDMEGGEISAITFYLSSSAGAAWGGTFEIRLCEIASNDFFALSSNSYKSLAKDTLVYSAGLDATGSTLTINFAKNYTYGGGNLLIDIKETATGTWKSATFAGESQSDYVCVNKYASSIGSLTSPSGTKFLPKATFTYTPAPTTCPKPTLTLDDKDDKSASFSWTAGGSETQWLYLNLPAATTLTDEHWSSATLTENNSVTINSLSANTDYVFYLRAYCSSSDTSKVVKKEYTTDCSLVSVPTDGISYDFEEAEDFVAGSLPDCWFTLKSATTEITPATYAYSSGYNSTAQSLHFQGYGSSYKTIVVLPKYALDIKNLKMSFYYKNGGTGTTRPQFAIGYVTNPKDISTYHELTTYARTTSWTSANINFSAAQYSSIPDGAYIAICHCYGSSNSSHGYIDKVKIESTIDCSKPAGVSVEQTGTGTATATWTAKSGVDNYQYCFVASGAEADWSGNLTIGTNSVNLSNLSAGNYDFYVKCVCGGDPSDAAPFTISACQEIDNVAHNNDVFNGTTVTWANGGSGPWDVYYSIDGGTNWTKANTDGLTTRSYNLTGLTPGNEYTIEVRNDCGSTASTTYSPVYTAPAGLAVAAANITDVTARATWNEVADVTNGYKYICQAAGSAAPSASAWASAATTNNTYADLSGLTVNTSYDFYVCSNYGGNLSAVAGPVTFTTVAQQPANVHLTADPSDTEATITWEAGGVETQWQYLCVTKNTAPYWNNVEPIEASALPITVSGLTALTDYDFYVRSYYSSSVQGTAVKLPFKTACGTNALGWKEEFSSSLPSCWTNESEWGATWQIYSYSDESYSGNYSLFYNIKRYNTSSSYDAVLTTPPVAISDEAVLSFYWKTTASASVEVFIKESGQDAESLGTLAPTAATSYAEKQYPIASKYIGKTVSFIFRGTGTGNSGSARYFRLDDVSVILKPCDAPEFAAANVEVTNDGATISCAADKWSLRYREYNAEPAASWNSVNDITSASHTLTGLSTEKTYEVQVKAVCSATRSSDWTASQTFTPVACPAVESASLSAKTYNSVTVNCSLTAAGTWDLQYKAGEGEWTAAISNITTTAQPWEVSVGTSYSFRVKPSCGSDWTNAGSYAPAYGVPGEPNVTDITVNSASATWSDALYGATGYEYVLMPGEAAANWEGAQDATSPLALSELTDGTNYTLYVRAQYGENRGEAASKNFTTATIAPAFTSDEPATTATTATIALEAYTGSAEKFQYVVMNGSTAANWASATLIAPTTSIALDELTAGSSYTLYVRAYYSATLQSTAVSKPFQTPCLVKNMDWSENFDGGALPACWDNSNYTSGWSTSYIWNASSNDAKSGSYSMMVRANKYSSYYTAELESPSIAITGKANLTYYWKSESGVPFTVNMKVNGVETQLASHTSAKSSWGTTPTTVAIPDTCVGKTLSIIFRATGAGTNVNRTLYVDDVQIIERPCPQLQNLAAVPTPDGATISWEQGDNENRYQYCVVDAGEAADGWVLLDEDVFSVTIDGKTFGNTYDCYVRSYCSATKQSEPLMVQFTPSCVAPSALSASAITGSSATISWTSNAGKLRYKTGSNDWSNETLSNATSFNLVGLAGQTTYTVQVQAACAADENEYWSEALEFTTKCALASAEELPLNEDFAAGVQPECWEATFTNEYSSFNNFLRFYGQEGEQMVILKGYDINLDTLTVSFDYHMSNAKLQFGYLASAGGAFKNLIELPAQTASTEYSVDLSALSAPAAAGYLAFRYFDATSDFSQAVVDNIHVARHATLKDSENNTATLAALEGKTMDIKIGRTFVKAGYYNTICLPFSLSADELAASPIATDDLWAFKYARVEGGELLIRIVEADHINAGEPYLIAWPEGANIENPLFKNVTISASAGKTMGEENLKFVGILAPETFTAGDDSKLFLYSNNTLYWWNGANDSHMNSFRAYFYVDGGAGSSTIKNMPARIVKHDNSATGCENINAADGQAVKLLENNQVVIIRNGVKYTIQGQKIQ